MTSATNPSLVNIRLTLAYLAEQPILQRRVYEMPARRDHNQWHGILSSTCFHTD